MRLELGNQPPVHILAVIAAQIIVGDHLQLLAQPLFKRRAPLRRIDGARFQSARPEQIDQRHRAIQHRLNRHSAAGFQQIIGILTFRQQRKPQGFSRLQMRKRDINGAKRRPPARFIAVKTQNRLIRHAPEQSELILGERRAQRRNGITKARAGHGDHIDIAFNRNHGAAIMRRLPRPMMIIKHPPLLKERRIGRIEVFGLYIGRHRPPAKRNHAAAHIMDRKHHAITKPVIGNRDILAMHQKSRFDHQLRRHALTRQMIAQRKPFAGGVSEAELGPYLARNTASIEIGPRFAAIRTLQNILKIGGGQRHNLNQPLGLHFALLGFRRHFGKGNTRVSG